MRTLRTILACVALLAALPSAASAQGGGAAAPPKTTADAGGGSFGSTVPAKKAAERPARRRHVYLNGRPARIRFTLSGRRAVPVRLRVLNTADRSSVATIDLGERAPGEHTATFTGLEAGVPPQGTYLPRLAGPGLPRPPPP